MSYYMRFITTDSEETTPVVLHRALQKADSRYSIAESGEIMLGDDVFGVVEVNLPGEELFEEEIEELKEFVEDVRGGRKKDVLKTLDAAKAIVAVQVLFGGRETDEVLEKLDPLWEWLMSNRKGLLQADGEGYYDQTGLILEVE